MNTLCCRCSSPATSLMSFAYDDGAVWLRDLAAMPAIGIDYALCEMHANRFTPPVGWVLTDSRSSDRPLFRTLEVA
jgi:Protein of unknown function (DUF3499)